MWILYILSFFAAFVFFIYLNSKFINNGLKRYIPILISIAMMVLEYSILSMLMDMFIYQRFWSAVFTTIWLIIHNFSLIGVWISITYLLDLLYMKIIRMWEVLSYIIQLVLGLILGICLPVLIFYVTEVRIYNWLPDYSPYKDQRDWAIVVICMYFFSNILFNISLIRSVLEHKVRIVIFNLFIFILATFIGILIQKNDLANLLGELLHF